MSLRIDATIQVVSECWLNAERTLQLGIKTSKPGCDEETITRDFHAEFHKSLKRESDRGKIELAFREDLEAEFGGSASGDSLDGISAGLIADVTLHKRSTEKGTGGDVGLVLARPSVSFASGQTALEIEEVHRRGLLGQAKLGDCSGDWGSLTQNQTKVLRNKLSYTALLLYKYNDHNRRHLAGFLWQTCVMRRIGTIQTWLKTGSFPSPVTSNVILRQLARDEIGTDDPRIIDTVIAPPKNTSLQIKIGWKEQRPDSRIYAYSHIQDKTADVVHVYRRA